MHYFAFVTRGPDGLYRASFPDLPAFSAPPSPIDRLQAATYVALADHVAVRSTPLPPPTPMDRLRTLYPADDGYWLSFVIEAPAPRT
jgi:hypothetical protein